MKFAVKFASDQRNGYRGLMLPVRGEVEINNDKDLRDAIEKTEFREGSEGAENGWMHYALVSITPPEIIILDDHFSM